jgi:hypothetical protein
MSEKREMALVFYFLYHRLIMLYVERGAIYPANC